MADDEKSHVLPNETVNPMAAMQAPLTGADEEEVLLSRSQSDDKNNVISVSLTKSR